MPPSPLRSPALPAPARGPALRAPARLAILALLALFAAALGPSCSGPSAPESEDASLPHVADDSCARFAFRFAAPGCPEAACAEPLCNCPSPIGCIPGKNERCMIAVDCAAACAVAPETLLQCAIDIAPCRVDADCREGLCVVEPGAVSGECESGQRGARCRNDQDCWAGNCVAGDGGNRACSPGEQDDLCNRASDCQSGRCALPAGSPIGACEP